MSAASSSSTISRVPTAVSAASVSTTHSVSDEFDVNHVPSQLMNTESTTLSAPCPIIPSSISLVNQGRRLFIGDRIKLYTTSPYATTGGYVGYLSQPLSGHGLCISVPPHVPDSGRFMVQTFSIWSPSDEINALAKAGRREPVTYGRAVVLVDEDGQVWNSKTGGITGYIGPRPRSQKGELHVAFDAPGRSMQQVCVGDRVEVDIADPNRRSKTYNKRLSVYRPKGGARALLSSLLGRGADKGKEKPTDKDTRAGVDLEVDLDEADKAALSRSVPSSPAHAAGRLSNNPTSLRARPVSVSRSGPSGDGVDASSPPKPRHAMDEASEPFADHARPAQSRSRAPSFTESPHSTHQSRTLAPSPPGDSAAPSAKPGRAAGLMSLLRHRDEPDDINKPCGGYIVCDGRGLTLSFVIHEARQHLRSCLAGGCDKAVCGNAAGYCTGGTGSADGSEGDVGDVADLDAGAWPMDTSAVPSSPPAMLAPMLPSIPQSPVALGGGGGQSQPRAATPSRISRRARAKTIFQNVFSSGARRASPARPPPHEPAAATAPSLGVRDLPPSSSYKDPSFSSVASTGPALLSVRASRSSSMPLAPAHAPSATAVRPSASAASLAVPSSTANVVDASAQAKTAAAGPALPAPALRRRTVSVEPLCGSELALVQDYFPGSADSPPTGPAGPPAFPRALSGTSSAAHGPADAVAVLLLVCVLSWAFTGAAWPCVCACLLVSSWHAVQRIRRSDSPLESVPAHAPPIPLSSSHSALKASFGPGDPAATAPAVDAVAAITGHAPPLEPLVDVPAELPAFSAGIPANLSLNPQQALQLLSSPYYHSRNSSYGLSPVPYREDGSPDPDLLVNGNAAPYYRIPDLLALSTLRQALSATETASSPLPPLAEAQKRPDFTQLLARVCMDLPARLIEAEEGDEDAARLRWYEAVRWRREHDVDSLLIRPYPLFERVRDLCSHYFHKHDRLGHIIYIDRPGLVRFKDMRTLGISDAALQRHFVHNCEYQWSVLDARPDAKVLTVLDMAGVGFMDMMGGSTMGLVKKMSKLFQLQYPVRSFKIVIVNAPSWFNSLWKMISPLLHPRTRAKTVVCGSDVKEMRATLLPLVAPESLPREYGGSCRCEGKDGCSRSLLERQYRGFVALVNARAVEEETAAGTDS